MPGYNSQRRGMARTLPKLIVLFYVLFVCKCVLYYCHRVSTQLHLTNISISICTLEEPGIDGKIILRWIFSKGGMWVWTGLSWLRIGTGGRHLWVRWWTCRFHKMRGISWLVENWLASEEGLCCMGWISFGNLYCLLSGESHVCTFLHCITYLPWIFCCIN